jgi:Ca-activated chloride channel family protein
MQKLSRAVKVPRSVKNQDPGNLLMLFYLAAVVGFLVLGLVSGSGASEALPKERAEPAEVRNGELLTVHDDGSFLPAPLLSQEVSMRVSGIVNRVKVVQHFLNDSDSWVEAVYVFPLPDRCAVDRMRLKIGERIVEGKIVEKQQAQKMHEQAKREGRKSGLVRQHRPNVFTTRVANIGPGEGVVVEIEYLQTAAHHDNIFSIRFPMAVGPRYVPGGGEGASVDFGKDGWASAMNRLAASAMAQGGPADRASIPVRLHIDLSFGVALARVDSLYHAVTARKLGEGHYDIELGNEVYADRDFVLQWEAEKTRQPQAALFSESVGGDRYMLLMLLPPAPASAVRAVPREVVFVLDISGSMAGTSIEQAKESVFQALDSLTELDSFNVIVFNNHARALFGVAKPANQANIDRARRHIISLKADGGTEMLPALKLALDGSHQHERLRQVIFLTDGAVSNEEELLALIARRLGDSRLFTVGIGSAPNGYFMTRAARMGRGTFVYIGDLAQVKTGMMTLLAKLTSPVLENLTLNRNGSGQEMEVYPSPLPDLYQGEPVFLTLKTGSMNSALQLTGLQAGRQWEIIVDTSAHGSGEGIAALWARKKIEGLMESLALGGNESESRQEVLETALQHHLVSRYTSLIGIDTQVSRPDNENVRRSMVRNHLPQGWQAAAVFGGGAQTASPGTLRVLSGLCLLAGAAGVHLYRRRHGRVR